MKTNCFLTQDDIYRSEDNGPLFYSANKERDIYIIRYYALIKLQLMSASDPRTFLVKRSLLHVNQQLFSRRSFASFKLLECFLGQAFNSVCYQTKPEILTSTIHDRSFCRPLINYNKVFGVNVVLTLADGIAQKR